MASGWKLLVRLGLPDEAIRPRPTRQGSDLASLGLCQTVVQTLSRDQLTPEQTDALAAWLSAFKRHWPRCYQRVFRWDGADLATLLSGRVHDANRYLKLRRIAISNLSQIL